MLENYVPYAVTIARRRRAVVGRTVTLDASEEFACRIGMHYAEVDAKLRDTDLAADRPTQELRSCSATANSKSLS